MGFAIGTGTDVAIEAADITLISGSLTGVVTAIEISKATMRNVKQNRFSAFIYNGLGVPDGDASWQGDRRIAGEDQQTSGLGLLLFYLGIITLAQGWGHAVAQLGEDRWFVFAIMIGFGTQVGLYTYIRRTKVPATSVANCEGNVSRDTPSVILLWDKRTRMKEKQEDASLSKENNLRRSAMHAATLTQQPSSRCVSGWRRMGRSPLCRVVGL